MAGGAPLPDESNVPKNDLHTAIRYLSVTYGLRKRRANNRTLAVIFRWSRLVAVSRSDNDKEPAVRFFWLILSLTFGPQGPLFRYILYHSAT